MSQLHPALLDAEQRYESSQNNYASQWVSSYFFLREVQDKALWKHDYKSFHAWLTDYCKRSGISNYPVFRRRLKAGSFYDDVIIGQNMGFFPNIEDINVSAESLITVQKIFEIDCQLATDVLTDLIRGNIGRKDLDAIYEEVRLDARADLETRKPQVAPRARVLAEDLEASEVPGLSRVEIQQILDDTNSWVYGRINQILEGKATFEIDPSAKKAITALTFGLDRGDQDLWKVLRPYVYKAKMAADSGASHFMLCGGPDGLWLESSSRRIPAREEPQVNVPSTVQKRGPKPQPWYDRQTALLIDTLLQFELGDIGVTPSMLHQLAIFLSSGPGTDQVVPTDEDRDAAQLVWFAMLGMTVANDFVGAQGKLPLGSLNGVIENGNKILVGTTTRLDFLFYSTEEEGREGYEQRLYRGHIQLSRLAVEALSSYRRYRELTLKQRTRAAAVASSLLNQALLDNAGGESDVPEKLRKLVRKFSRKK